MPLSRKLIVISLFLFLSAAIPSFADENSEASYTEDQKRERLAEIDADRQKLMDDYQNQQATLETQMKEAMAMPSSTQEEKTARKAKMREITLQKKESKKTLNAELKNLNDEEKMVRIGKEAVERRQKREEEILKAKQQLLLQKKREQARAEQKPEEQPVQKKPAPSKEASRSGYDSSEKHELHPKINVGGIDRINGMRAQW